MAGLPRKAQKVFASSIPAAGNIAVFGTLKNPPKTFSGDVEAIQANAAWLGGMQASLVGNNSPSVEDLNALFYVCSSQIAYLLSRGIPEWSLSADTVYNNQDLCRRSGILFECIVDDTSGAGHDPLTDTNNWRPYFSVPRGPGTAAAWVEFDGINSVGGNAPIHGSMNVSSVTREADGIYVINFANALSSSHYALSGGGGAEDGQGMGAGDSCIITNSLLGHGTALRSATQCRIFTIDPATKALVTSGDVSFLAFAM